ncbi:hypothetical protein [Embleya sp. NPDC050493]
MAGVPVLAAGVPATANDSDYRLITVAAVLLVVITFPAASRRH